MFEMLGMFLILWLATSGSIFELAGKPLLAFFDERSGILDSNFGLRDLLIHIVFFTREMRKREVRDFQKVLLINEDCVTS